ncbi:hypothetical protein PSP31120_01277 [Pandoraea sputorum]|nr:hypothetical protein PSP31120_01277 [Pandoraea sputorum]
MCVGGVIGSVLGVSQPDAPKVVAPPESASTSQTLADAQSRERARAAAASGRQSTILTGSQGVANTNPTGQAKTLLGQ